MKTKIVLTVLMLGMIMGAKAQKPTMTLTFTADNNGQHVPLNSILIENLTQGGDTTLYAPDTVLVLDYITSMPENFAFDDHSFFLSQSFPNPMIGKTTVSLYLPEKLNVSIMVSDVIGKELVNKKIKLKGGRHSFSFYPGRESLYFFTAHTDRQSQTIKMLNSPSHANASGYCKLEYNGRQKTGVGEYKSGNALNNFVFNPGNQLKFTAFADLGERVMTSSPAADQTYYFHYTGEPCPGTPTVTDIDGNVYNTVQIGTQCWMKENLKTTTYNNGTLIPDVTEANAWSNLTTGAYVWYDNDIGWKDSYGVIYNWHAAIDINGLCPTGWHVPTNDEWAVLTAYLGGTGSPHGNTLKSCRQENSPLGGGCNTSEYPRWDQHSTHYGTDGYGFSGLPGGSRSYGGPFGGIGSFGGWWSSTEISPSSTFAWFRGLDYYSASVNAGYSHKRYGYSVRCLRD